MLPKQAFVLAGVTALLVSCGNDTDGPPLAGQATASHAEGEKLYYEAKHADDAGNASKAIKLYEKSADLSPSAPTSAQARIRQAQLLEKQGDVIAAFDAYQKFLERYQASNLYAGALKRQAEMAQSAADGEVKTSFLGLKSSLSTDKVVGMLEKVRDNAPRSATASKAQFTIGELHQSRKDDKEAIDAFRKLVRDYPDSKEAPEAQFRIGKVFVAQAARGNQNLATLDLAREALQDYLTQYPGHSKNAEAKQLLADLGGRNVQRTFDVAEFYLKTGEKESAKVYYRNVVKRTGSGELHDKAKARLAELGER